jgi:hypothetical protein
MKSILPGGTILSAGATIVAANKANSLKKTKTKNPTKKLQQAAAPASFLDWEEEPILEIVEHPREEESEIADIPTALNSSFDDGQQSDDDLQADSEEDAKAPGEENEDIRNFAKLGYIDSGFTLENPKILSIWDKGNLEENE